MLLRRYGAKYASVVPRFDARALTEIGFTRTDDFEVTVEEFDAGWIRTGTTEFATEVEGAVQDEAEVALLGELTASIQTALDGLQPGEVLVVENQTGQDHPKTRDRKRPVIVDGENRLRFEWRVDPPLRLGTYRKA